VSDSDTELGQETGSFILDSGGIIFHYYCTPHGVACNHSEGVEDKFSVRMKDGLHLRGLTESEVLEVLWTPPEPEVV